MPAPIPPFIRLLSGYTKSSNDCWEWGGHTYKNGYGCLKAFGKIVSAHKLSYELHKGPVPVGMEIMHSCDNKICINPDHLRAGTHAENMADAASRGLMHRGPRVNHTPFSVKRPKQAIPVRVLGVVYESQNAAERALGLGSGTVRYWIMTKSGKASLLKECENDIGE